VQNEQPLKAYSQSIYSGVLPIARGIGLSETDKLRRAIIEDIMCNLTVDLAARAAEYGTDISALQADVEKLKPLTLDDICTLDGHTVTVTETGRPFVRLVASAFDEYLSSGLGRHSKAV
jgi:oxygen-independent coproporphyrinogen-3 oxidase